MTSLVTQVVELEFCVQCTDTLPSQAVSSCQLRFILLLPADVLKNKLAKFGGYVPFSVVVVCSEM